MAECILTGSGGGSGGASKAYVAELILSEANGFETGTAYAFLNGAKLSDFDAIEVLCSTRGDKDNGDTSFSHFTYSVLILQVQPTAHIAEYGTRWGAFTVSNDSLTQIAAEGEYSQFALRIYYVYGIKY